MRIIFLDPSSSTLHGEILSIEGVVRISDDDKPKLFKFNRHTFYLHSKSFKYIWQRGWNG